MHKLFNHSSFGLARSDKVISDDSFDLRIYDDILIAVVCDGVGSALKAKEASQKMTNYLINNFNKRIRSWDIHKTLDVFIRQCNNILFQESMIEYESCEKVTTLSVIIISGNRLYGANVGDSHLYLLRDGTMEQLCMDHSLKNEGMEHVLTQAIGLSKEVFPYFFENDLKVDDRLLLCSDGLYNTLSLEDMQAYMHLSATSLVKKASQISNDNLLDDTTAILVQIKELDNKETLKTMLADIPLKLTKGDIFDGFVLDKSMIGNDRTWLSYKDDKKFILKFASLEAIDSEMASDLFVLEIVNATKLESKSFPKAFVPKTRTARYYVMEYIEGITLSEYLKNNRLSVDLSIELALFLLNSEQYLIRRDLVHGDIKPDNIIINDNKFTLIDYGSVAEAFSINSRAGTPSYLAPERFTDESISESSEIYSIGVTIYQALSNKLPFGEIEPFSSPSFDKDIKQISTHNKSIPLWLENIISRMITPDTNKRYVYYSEVIYDFTHPEKVKPFFNKNASLLEKYPTDIYRYSLFASLLAHLIIFIFTYL